MIIQDFTKALNDLFTPQNYHDFCPNGLIVNTTPNSLPREIHKVITGVSLRMDLIMAAVKEQADAIIVHHPNGFWFSEKDKRIIDSNFANYTRELITAQIALYGFHLPLDGHNSLGNNITVAEKLHLEPNTVSLLDPTTVGCDVVITRKGYDRFMQDNIGVGGEGVITDELLSEVFPKGYQSFNFESGKKYKVAICTGSGSSELEEAYKRGYDMFVTGEIRESTPIFATEHNMAVIAAGHHRSEVFCVSNLANYINENFNGVSAKFIDIDNPI